MGGLVSGDRLGEVQRVGVGDRPALDRGLVERRLEVLQRQRVVGDLDVVGRRLLLGGERDAGCLGGRQHAVEGRRRRRSRRRRCLRRSMSRRVPSVSSAPASSANSRSAPLRSICSRLMCEVIRPLAWGSAIGSLSTRQPHRHRQRTMLFANRPARFIGATSGRCSGGAHASRLCHPRGPRARVDHRCGGRCPGRAVPGRHAAVDGPCAARHRALHEPGDLRGRRRPSAPDPGLRRGPVRRGDAGRPARAERLDHRQGRAIAPDRAPRARPSVVRPLHHRRHASGPRGDRLLPADRRRSRGRDAQRVA